MDKKENKQNDLTLAIIAKNEEKGLEKAITSCRSFVKEVIVVVDDKSTDKTLKVAKKCADRVVLHTWQDSFAEARNFAQKYVKTKWVLYLDGHEYVEEYKNLAKMLKQNADALFIRIRMETGFTFYFPRIVKKEVKWQHKVHNTPKSKKNIKYQDFLIIHDRIHGQEKKAQEMRKKQREKMLNENLGKDAKKNKRNSRANFYMANLALDSRDFKKAIWYYKRCAKYSKSKDQRWLAKYNICVCYNELRKHLNALWSIKAAEKEMPDRWETAKMRGITYALLGRDLDAATHLIDSFKINTTDFRFCPVVRNDAQTWDFIGIAFFQMNNIYKAKVAWNQAIRVNQESMQPLLTEERIRILRALMGPSDSKIGPENPIEVCCCVYARADRVPKILEQLKAQTVQNFKVNLWNNSGKKLDISNFPQKKIQVIESETNIGSQARFRLAKKTMGNPIIFFDDDENLAPNFIEYNYNEHLKYGPKVILGWFTRTFKQESYWKSTGANYGQEVDYIATKAMILDREIIDKEPLLQNIPEDFAKVEDLYLCYLARMKYNMKMIRINRTTTPFIDNKDQWKNIDKENAFSLLRKKGWWLLKDGIRNFGGLNFKIRKGQWDEAILTGETDPKYYQIPQNPRIIIDLGAHIGGTSILAASLGADVYAYEPENENFKLLKENAKLNNLENKIHCFQKGVGIPGKRKLYLNPKNSGMATLEPDNNPTQEVNIIGIDKVFEKIDYCDLLKIDCEGAEYEFIKDIPFEKIDQISMELHEGKQQEIINLLKQHYSVEYKTALNRTGKMVICKPKKS